MLQLNARSRRIFKNTAGRDPSGEFFARDFYRLLKTQIGLIRCTLKLCKSVRLLGKYSRRFSTCLSLKRKFEERDPGGYLKYYSRSPRCCVFPFRQAAPRHKVAPPMNCAKQINP